MELSKSVQGGCYLVSPTLHTRYPVPHASGADNTHTFRIHSPARICTMLSREQKQSESVMPMYTRWGPVLQVAPGIQLRGWLSLMLPRTCMNPMSKLSPMMGSVLLVSMNTYLSPWAHTDIASMVGRMKTRTCRLRAVRAGVN